MTNLLIPADMVPSLTIPDLALTTGEPGGIWCSRSWGRMRWSRRYVVRLPYDPVAAAKLRKHAAFDRVHMVVLPLFLVGMLSFWLRPIRTPWPIVASAGMVALALLDARWDVEPKPSRTGRGDLYLPDLPPAVAQQWLETNPGVREVDRKPAYRRWPPWVYLVTSLVCAAGTVGAARYAPSGDELPLETLFVVLTLTLRLSRPSHRAYPSEHRQPAVIRRRRRLTP